MAVVDVAKYCCFNYVLCVVVVLFQLLSPLSRSRLGLGCHLTSGRVSLVVSCCAPSGS